MDFFFENPLISIVLILLGTLAYKMLLKT